jgi:hypothetical protein
MEVKYEVTLGQLPKNIVAMVLTNEIKSTSEFGNMLNDATLCLTSGMHGIKTFRQISFCSKMQTQGMFPSKKVCERAMVWD